MNGKSVQGLVRVDWRLIIDHHLRIVSTWIFHKKKEIKCMFYILFLSSLIDV